jgi:hypothetical protein
LGSYSNLGLSRESLVAIKKMIDHIFLFIELILLVLIWLDGRSMLRSSLNTEGMYREYFDELRKQRLARQEAAKKAREAKAQKAGEGNAGKGQENP